MGWGRWGGSETVELEGLQELHGSVEKVLWDWRWGTL